jgi:hypothetical protein
VCTDRSVALGKYWRSSPLVFSLDPRFGQNWFGADSTQFASDWASYSRQLQNAANAIAAMSRTARAQASDQQVTSGS